MSTVTKPVVLDESYNDKMDELISAIGGISLGRYVIVNVNNYTWGSVTGGGLYPAGTPVTLTATPSEDCYFLCWKNANGDILSIESTYTFTPSANTVIQADFNADEYVKIVSWASGTDVELNAMLDAHYRGVIDIHDYWSVGDTRTVALSAMPSTDGTVNVNESHIAQDVEWVLMDETLTGFTPVGENENPLSFIVGMKDCLIEPGYVVETSHYASGVAWSLSSRHAWCNSIFMNSIPTLFKNLFRQFQHDTYQDYFTLFYPSMISTQCIAWYVNRENMIKKSGINGETTDWWACAGENTGYISNTYYVKIDGTVATRWGNASTFRLSLFGCI